ncbi:hypothetical protein [Verrucomicrobium sp. BvORR034]|uniref:hypothetical protein n=1 Tax=Verrucomicrobium sp. BvORR034 TaxID=1396418 RepID=UPI00067911F0|nr:hypothetical protein [Verrucomicrobium sp. BvORR034]
MPPTIHVFSGRFLSRSEACRYTERQWQDVVDDNNDADCTWLLSDDLGVGGLNSDFIETIFGGDLVEYLESQLRNEEDRAKLREELSIGADTLVLIMSPALRDNKAKLSSVSKLQYHGQFQWWLGD